MKEYLEVLEDILDNGREKESGRANMPNTIGLSHATILMKDVFEKYPLLSTKKMFWKGIVHELLWFLRGETNIKYLVDNGVNIWNGDAYRWYLKWWDEYGKEINFPKYETQEEFVEVIKNNKDLVGFVNDYEHKSLAGTNTNALKQYVLGDLGKVYGYQWRNQNGVDQIKDIFEDLTKNPYGRYKILDAWNKKEFPEMALPPCHLLYQFIVRPMTLGERRGMFLKQWKEKWGDASVQFSVENMDNEGMPKYFLDVNMYQRSCDTFLGVPFNIASMSLLLMIMAKAVGMVAGEAFWIGGDTHLYKDHLPMVKEQISRIPYDLPKMNINKELNSLEDIMELTIDDFELVNYKSFDSIKAELFTGLKKK